MAASFIQLHVAEAPAASVTYAESPVNARVRHVQALLRSVYNLVMNEMRGDSPIVHP